MFNGMQDMLAFTHLFLSDCMHMCVCTCVCMCKFKHSCLPGTKHEVRFEFLLFGRPTFLARVHRLVLYPKFTVHKHKFVSTFTIINDEKKEIDSKYILSIFSYNNAKIWLEKPGM